MILTVSDYAKVCCCCQNRLMIREIASWFWLYQTMQKSISFQSHLTSSSYKNSSFFPKLFTTKSYNQKQKFITLTSTQPHQHFTLIYQESQFIVNGTFSSKLLKQQLHKMEHPWYNSTTTTYHNNNNIIKPGIHHNSTTQYHNSTIRAQLTIYSFIHIMNLQFHHNNSIIIKFIYPNVSL